MELSKFNHCKDLTPKETVKNIKDFFTSLGDEFYIKECSSGESGFGTFWLNVKLYYQNLMILSANGKGYSKAFCEASAYAELYERFSAGIFFPMCSVTGFLSSDLECDDFSLYSVNPSIQQGCKNLYNYRYFPKRDNLIYQEINTKEECIINPYLLYSAIGSTGLAAGNTIDEALVQSISEICERHVQSMLFFQQAKMRLIDNALIKEACEDTWNVVQNMLNEHFSVTFYDASYVCGLPVVASLLVNIDLNVCAIRFGSSPNFRIAIERCITETFQGRKFDFPFIEPSVKQDESGLNQGFCNGNVSYPESIYDTENVVYSINQDAFCFAVSNDELLKKYKDIFLSQNIKCFFSDISLAKTTKTVSVSIPKLAQHTNRAICSTDTLNAVADRILAITNAASSSYQDLLYLKQTLFSDEGLMVCSNITNQSSDRGLFILSIITYLCGDKKAAYILISKANTCFAIDGYERFGLYKLYLTLLNNKVHTEKIKTMLIAAGYSESLVNSIIFNDSEELFHNYLQPMLKSAFAISPIDKNIDFCMKNVRKGLLHE